MRRNTVTIYDLPTERQNVFDRSVGHLRAMARETRCEVERMKLNMLAKALEGVLDGISR